MAGLIGGAGSKSGLIGVESRYSQPFLSCTQAYQVSAGNVINNWANVTTNYSGHFSTSTGIWKVPVPGLWLFTFGVLTLGADSRTEIQLEESTNSGSSFSSQYTAAMNGSAGGGNYDGGTTCFIRRAPKANVYQYRVKLTGGSMYDQHNNNIFCAVLI